MPDETKVLKTPYTPFSTYLNFINELSESPLPAHIDKSLMPTMSGGMQSVLMSALRNTGFINEGGEPAKRLVEYVNGDEQDRKGIIGDALRQGFPYLFDGSIELGRATPQRFDDRLREAGGVSGSTLDKAAAFFLAGAEHCGLDLSAHLKRRKPSSRKTNKQRRQGVQKKADEQGAVDRQTPESPTRQAEPDPEMVLLKLLDPKRMTDEEKQAVWTLILYAKNLKAAENELDPDEA